MVSVGGDGVDGALVVAFAFVDRVDGTVSTRTGWPGAMAGVSGDVPPVQRVQHVDLGDPSAVVVAVGQVVGDGGGVHAYHRAMTHAYDLVRADWEQPGYTVAEHTGSPPVDWSAISGTLSG